MLLVQGGTSQPRGTVAGRIVTTSGTPVVALRVIAITADSGIGREAEVTIEGMTQTDGSGRYRLELSPGRYRILAGALTLPTYFPGVTQLAKATVVVVTDKSINDSYDFEV